MAKTNATIILKHIKNHCKALWNYRGVLKLELLFFFYLAPLHFSNRFNDYLLEKACRVNFQYNNAICSAILDKADYEVECKGFNFQNTTRGSSLLDWNITIDSLEFNYTVCKADNETEDHVESITGSWITTVISVLTVILFAGWDDRYNKRKLFMALPFVGQSLANAWRLISAIFFVSLPVEFDAYMETYVPELFGDFISVRMAILSYITVVTSARDRFFRFNIFRIFAAIYLIIFRPMGDNSLFKYCDYTVLCIIALVCQIIATVLVVFFIEDTEVVLEKRATLYQATDSPTFAPYMTIDGDSLKESKDTANNSTNQEMTVQNIEMDTKHEPSKEQRKTMKCRLFREIFDYTIVKDFVTFLLKKRENSERMILILLVSARFLTIATTHGGDEHRMSYTETKFHWNQKNCDIYYTKFLASNVIGSFIAAFIFSKALGLNDSIIGIILALFEIFAEIVSLLAPDTTFFYISGMIHLFRTGHIYAIESIGSNIVTNQEISKLFAFFEIFEPISQFAFPVFYNKVYKQTYYNFPGFLFALSGFFYIYSIFAFTIHHVTHEREDRKDGKTSRTVMMNT